MFYFSDKKQLNSFIVELRNLLLTKYRFSPSPDKFKHLIALSFHEKSYSALVSDFQGERRYGPNFSLEPTRLYIEDPSESEDYVDLILDYKKSLNPILGRQISESSFIKEESKNISSIWDVIGYKHPYQILTAGLNDQPYGQKNIMFSEMKIIFRKALENKATWDQEAANEGLMTSVLMATEFGG